MRRRKLVADLLDNSAGDNWCQVILLIQQVDPNHRCGLHLADGHEIKTRGRGGSIVDEENVIGVCRPCHQWIGAHPIEAQELGLTKWSYEE